MTNQPDVCRWIDLAKIVNKFLMKLKVSTLKVFMLISEQSSPRQWNKTDYLEPERSSNTGYRSGNA